MKKIKKFIMALFMFPLISSCSDSPQDILGTYSSLSNGSIEIIAFDGDEGEFLAKNVILPRLNNSLPYTTLNNESEIFAVARVVGDNYTIRFSIDGVAYIGIFDSKAMNITVEGTIYEII